MLFWIGFVLVRMKLGHERAVCRFDLRERSSRLELERRVMTREIDPIGRRSDPRAILFCEEPAM